MRKRTAPYQAVGSLGADTCPYEAATGAAGAAGAAFFSGFFCMAANFCAAITASIAVFILR